MLLPRVLRLGYAFLSSDALATVAQPLLARAAADLGESCSLGIRDGDEVCYLARAEASRIMSIALRVGSRLPLYCTSMGRVLLAHASPAEQKAYLDRTVLTARTADTVTDPEALLALLRTVREQGYALVDQELEIGLRSIAVPVFGRDRTLLGALNVGAQSVRVSPEQLLDHYLPALQQISVELGLQGVR
ncbi:IclR family transcriptional regulator C-terminal domain-containing protein [Novosphingobium sp. G106]|nr:IclR family transcriptional regulator C-terminal domain-containing protein [Novosphingobium sp. G106]